MKDLYFIYLGCFFAVICGCTCDAFSQTNEKDVLKECIDLYKQKGHEQALECLAGHKGNIYAFYYAALIADSLNDVKRFKENSEQLIARKTRTARSYGLYADLHKKDTARLEGIVKKGLKYFPHDTTLLIHRINLLIKQNDYKGCVPLLKDLIANKQTGKKTLYFALGYACEASGDTAGAFYGYRQALALDASYFDPWYNMAALHFNAAVDLYTKANEERNEKKYLEIVAMAKEELKKALPYLIIADSLVPDDPAVLESLQAVYFRLKMTDEHLEITKRINQIKKK